MKEKLNIGRIFLGLAGQKNLSEKERNQAIGLGVGLMITGMLEDRLSRPFQRFGRSRRSSFGRRGALL